MSLPRAGAESADFISAPAAVVSSAASSAVGTVGSSSSSGERERSGGGGSGGREGDAGLLTRADALVELLQKFVDRTADVQSAIAFALTLLDAASLFYDPLQRLQSPSPSAAAGPPALRNIARTVASWIDEYDICFSLNECTAIIFYLYL